MFASVVRVTFNGADGAGYLASAVVKSANVEAKIPEVVLWSGAHVTLDMKSNVVISSDDFKIVVDGVKISYEASYHEKFNPHDPDAYPFDAGSIRLTGEGLRGIKFETAKVAASGANEGDRVTIVGFGTDEQGNAGNRRYGTSRIKQLVGPNNVIRLSRLSRTMLANMAKPCADFLCFVSRQGALADLGDSGGGSFNSKGELTGVISRTKNVDPSLSSENKLQSPAIF